MVETAAPATERLRVEQVVSEDTRQAVVRAKISVPDPKPDVDKILSIDRTAKVKKKTIVPDKVIVEGTLTLQIVYVAFKPNQAVHHMHQTIPFTAFVDVPGARPGMELIVKVTVEDVNITPHPDCARDFDVAAVLAVFAKVTEMREIDVITQCPNGCVCDTELIKVADVVADDSRQIIVSDEFTIPDKKPAVEKILEVHTEAEITETKVIRDKVIVEGKVTIQVVYVALEKDQPVHHLHRSFAFSDFVEVEGARQDMDVRVNVMVESADVDLVRHKPDRLQADVVLLLTAVATQQRQINLITNINDCEVSPTFTLLRVDEVVGEESTQVIIRDTFETPDPKPAVEKILQTTVDEVKINEIKILRDKVVIRGFLDVQIVYVAFEKDQSVHAMHRRIDFRTFVEVSGAREGMDVDVRTMVEFITADADGCDITLEIVLKVMVKVTESMQRDVLTGMEEAPTPTPTSAPCPPGEIRTTYTVRSGDTLGRIAKQFDVTVRQILAVNPQITNPDRLNVGDVIQIPCPKPMG